MPIFFLSSYLKNNGLVVLLEVEGKDISEHECGAALAEHIHSLLQKLHLNPGHVVLLHLLHFLLDLSIELVLKAQALHVVHVAVAVEQVPLQGGSGALHRHSMELILIQKTLNSDTDQNVNVQTHSTTSSATHNDSRAATTKRYKSSIKIVGMNQ